MNWKTDKRKPINEKTEKNYSFSLFHLHNNSEKQNRKEIGQTKKRTQAIYS